MASLEDIAAAVGVSKSTVSLVLNGKARKARISEKRIKEITEVANKMNFVPNAAARAIRRGRFGQLGLLLSNIPQRAILLPGLLESIRETLSEKDQLLLLGQLPDEKLTDDDELPRVLREWAADGLLINYLEAVPERMRQLLDEHRVPTVWLNIKRDTDAVYADNKGAGKAATEHLLGLGHTKIAYLAMGITGHYSKIDREAGYREAMEAAGQTPSVHQWKASVHASQRVAEIRKWMEAQRDAGTMPTALVTYGQG
ncbi:MAG: LacI family DNA-binding transcriptional regulator, partial [Planctomycetota bacterium]